MSKNEQKLQKGDMVLIVDSYAGGRPFIGQIVEFVQYGENSNSHKEFNCVVKVGEGTIWAKVALPTELMKALL